MDVRKQKTILIIVLMLLLSATGAFAASPQVQLSPEKKKALRKFDPVDIVPEMRGSEAEARDSQGDRGRKKSKQPAGSPTLSRDASAAPISTAVVPAAPRPTATPGAQLSPTPQATPSLASKAKPDPTQSASATAQSSESTVAGSLASAATGKESVRAAGLSLPVIFSLLGLILLALVAVAARIKKDLRAL